MKNVEVNVRRTKVESSVGEHALLLRNVKEKWTDWFEKLENNHSQQKSI